MVMSKLQKKLRKIGEKNSTLGFAIDKADELVGSLSEDELKQAIKDKGLDPYSKDKRDKIRIKRILRKFGRKK